MHWIQAVDGARYVHADEDLNTMIVWNGSATFNVYTQIHKPNGLHPADCFTRCFTPAGYGPEANVPWGRVKDWAKRVCEHWIEDNIENDDDY